MLWKFRTLFGHRTRPPSTQDRIVDDFHRLYYGLGASGKTWCDTRWMGIPVGKNPMDTWIYQEILFELRPDLIVECGTAHGGGAVFLGTICDLVGNGRVISIDVAKQPAATHPRVSYITDSSTAPAVVARIRQETLQAKTVLVILDSDHSKDHVLKELQAYSPFVTPGSYLIVEDTNVNGHPVFPEHGPGPYEALQIFLRNNPDFEVDRSREKLLFTFNPSGYLKRRTHPPHPSPPSPS